MSATLGASSPALRLTPGLAVAEPAVDAWIGQVVLRLRREISWCWHQRLGQADPGDGTLPPEIDAAAESLDFVRFERQKRAFWESDPAARYLTEEIAALTPPDSGAEVRGGWTWLARELELDGAAQLVLALALAGHLDAGLGPVSASCMNDLSRPFPTLALAQRLHEDPLAVVACADPNHALYRYGLLLDEPEAYLPAWQRPLRIHDAVARRLVEPAAPLAAGLRPARPARRPELRGSAEALVERLLRPPPRLGLQAVPLLGPAGTDFEAWAGALAERTGRELIAPESLSSLRRLGLPVLATLAWMAGCDVLLPADWAAGQSEGGALAGLEGLPVRWYVPIEQQRQLRLFAESHREPPLEIGATSFAERVECLRTELGKSAVGLEEAIEECARRFRFQELTLTRISRAAAATEHLDAAVLLALCRGEVVSELGSLAQPVVPRFEPGELVLPVKQRRQFDEVRRAMGALTQVHYHWGTARVWNESGLSVLFCGPPGTGKTMAAEALATALKLPMYRIDLSQVINKYIGETEKNLKRIFDAGELADCLLFFDEADALFGKRTEVKDAHDRFANIEISYLLERMERFKGLAILATNRRKDLDEAFLRRLRYVIEFPLPGREERELLWRRGFPEGVGVQEIDFTYLAKQFQLAGGNIRSIIFNACLQSAGTQRERDAAEIERRVDMPTLLVAVQRELEKMNRNASRDQFGSYRDLVVEEAA